MSGTRRRRWDFSIGREARARYSERMRVELLYFGVLKERLGMVGERVELAEGASVGDLLRILRGRTSNNPKDDTAGNRIEARVWEGLAVAVNREYAAASVVLREGDEVALLPPVSGGAARTAKSSRCSQRLVSGECGDGD